MLHIGDPFVYVIDADGRQVIPAAVTLELAEWFAAKSRTDDDTDRDVQRLAQLLAMRWRPDVLALAGEHTEGQLSTVAMARALLTRLADTRDGEGR